MSILTPIIEAFSQRGQLVLDPFAGSGSTCMAAKSSGRNYIGIELDPKYHAIAMRRLTSHVGEGSSIPKRCLPRLHPDDVPDCSLIA